MVIRGYRRGGHRGTNEEFTNWRSAQFPLFRREVVLCSDGLTGLQRIVRFLILSDIHANLDALEACLDAAPEYDAVANLGDIVGYGACPNEVIDRSRELGSLVIRGNH